MSLTPREQRELDAVECIYGARMANNALGFRRFLEDLVARKRAEGYDYDPGIVRYPTIKDHELWPEAMDVWNRLGPEYVKLAKKWREEETIDADSAGR